MGTEAAKASSSVILASTHTVVSGSRTRNMALAKRRLRVARTVVSSCSDIAAAPVPSKLWTATTPTVARSGRLYGAPLP